MRRPRCPLALPAALAVATLGLAGCGAPSHAEPVPAASPVVDEAFWRHWGDGLAEVAHYDLTFPRYGAERSGTAVAIFVTEPFSESARVKADPGRHADDDVFQVLKLNLVKDFPTGIYDYNTMLSGWVGLAPSGGRPAGAPVKVSYTSQEWCGHAFHQVLFDDGGIRESLRSYFDGEGDLDVLRERPAGAVAEDLLPLWARGLAGPVLDPGGTATVPVLTSLQEARLRHVPAAWAEVRLTRAAGARAVAVPAGTFEAERMTAEIPGLRTWTFEVERDPPRRLLRWESSTGERGELVAAERLSYWTLNGPDGGAALERLGLRPRPPRTP